MAWAFPTEEEAESSGHRAQQLGSLHISFLVVRRQQEGPERGGPSTQGRGLDGASGLPHPAQEPGSSLKRRHSRTKCTTEEGREWRAAEKFQMRNPRGDAVKVTRTPRTQTGRAGDKDGRTPAWSPQPHEGPAAGRGLPHAKSHHCLRRGRRPWDPGGRVQTQRWWLRPLPGARSSPAASPCPSPPRAQLCRHRGPGLTVDQA